LGCRLACEYKNTGADNGANAQGGEMDRPQGPFQPVILVSERFVLKLVH
jgi:hypothetical protein